MSKALSLKLRDDVFEETEKILKKMHRTRNTYFNEAITFYNKLCTRRQLARVLAKESKAVAAESMTVLAEFEAFQGDLAE